jgi:ABC-type dipeptide/oligopeptide/nickel transport system permease subunit
MTATHAIDRSDAFDDTKVESKSADGLEAVFSAAVKQQYFLFGTDNVGRDLMTRTLWPAASRWRSACWPALSPCLSASFTARRRASSAAGLTR